jgi:hypothetical protein
MISQPNPQHPPELRLVEEEPEPAPTPRTRFRLWRGLLWNEWFAHSRLIVVFLFVWLAAVWLLPLVLHPLWILVVGVLYALVAGPAFGGADVIDGSEEFTFSLPTTRSQQLAARIAVSGAGLMALTLMNVMALDANLSDLLVRLFLDSGLGGVEVRQPEMLLGLVFAFPFAIYACGFSVAALATSRTVAFTAWVWGALGALATLRGAAMLEESLSDRLTGRITVPSLLLVGLACLTVAVRLYSRKEAGPAGSPLHMPWSWWGGLALLLAAAAGVALLLSWLSVYIARLL